MEIPPRHAVAGEIVEQADIVLYPSSSTIHRGREYESEVTR